LFASARVLQNPSAAAQKKQHVSSGIMTEKISNGTTAPNKINTV
jgi:hypothetical protein